MRGRVAVPLSLIIFLLGVPAWADCNYSLIESTQFRASYLDLAIDGTDLWTATSYGVSLFDRSVDPPALVTSIALPGITRAVRIANGNVYAASGPRVYVLRRNGRSVAITASYEAGAIVNDLVATTLDLYVATTSGLQQVDTLTLQKTAAILPTSSANVTSLSLNNTTLYAADGDSSIEVFSIAVASLPQHTGTIESLQSGVTFVEATPTRLYATNGFSTDVFFANSSVRVTTVTGGTIALATLKDDVLFAAGSDRRIRAIDWTTAGTPIDLFATDIVPNGGTINRVGAMQIAGGRLYVAAGDAGLLTYDVSTFVSPFAVRSYPFTAMTSTAWVDGKLYASRSSGGISEFVKSSGTGYLTAARQWDAKVHTVWEGANGFLLTSSGKTLYYWTLISTTPTLITSATLPATITSASLHHSSASVALDDGSVWSVDLAALAPTPARVSGIAADSLRWTAGDALAFARANSDGTTGMGWVLPAGAGKFTTNVSGISTLPIAASDPYSAIFTFTGINVSDSRTLTTFVLPGSNTPIARQLAIRGTRLFELTDTSLLVWDLTTRKIIRRISLPAEGVSLSVDALAAIATASGIEAVDVDAAQAAPVFVDAHNGNVYYRKLAASPDRLYLGTSTSIDMYETAFGSAPHHLLSFRGAGVVDFAASAGALYVVSNTNVVTAYSRMGGLLAQRALDVDGTTQPLAIHVAGNAIWVAISRGCTTGGCEKKTLVVDPLTLVQTGTLDGGAVDVTTSGTRAYAIFDLPAEVRTYDVSAPLAPAQLARVAAPGTRTPVSIAFANNTVYVAGDKLYAYEPLLTQRTDNLDVYQADPTGATAFADQRLRTEGTCALFSRGLQPQWLALPQLTPKAAPSPAPVRAIAQTPGRFWLLTDDSIELWSSAGTNPPPPRHRATGH